MNAGVAVSVELVVPAVVNAWVLDPQPYTRDEGLPWFPNELYRVPRIKLVQEEVSPGGALLNDALGKVWVNSVVAAYTTMLPESNAIAATTMSFLVVLSFIDSPPCLKGTWILSALKIR
ncbi:MAG: hypothetical protein KGI38_03925 [Thaumarchaeota archaeon]|nr:hypothetical protein [Nitrososphaerota archaeon]